MSKKRELPTVSLAESDRWATPQEIFEHYRSKYDIQIDACAEPHNAKCPIYISPERDCLKTNWLEFAKEHGVKPIFWMNPPYSREFLGRFVYKAAQESSFGCMAISLLPPSIDTAWFHDYIYQKDNVLWTPLRGRITFVPPPGYTGKLDTAKKGSIVAVFNPGACHESE